jgi:hypothetical protein
VPAFALLAVVFQRVSRNARSSARSREVLKSAGANIFAHFIQQRPQSSVFLEIRIDLPVPGGIFTLTNKGRQFGLP